MPPRPSATARTDDTASCQFFGETSGSATGSSHFVIGSQSGANWIQPPTTDSTASTATVAAIETPTTSRRSAWKCSRTNALCSPPNTMKNMRNV